MAIFTATIVVCLVGLVIGIALVNTEKKFHVEVDPRVTQVRECLPGNNCGACGYAGCDAVADAIAKGEAPANACPVCSADRTAAIGEIMGVKVEAAERRVAYVRCSGSCDKTASRGKYVGIEDCRAAALSGLELGTCGYGCLGLGSCAKACQNDAIRIKNNLAYVDDEKCIGCGLCVNACPNHLIALTPKSKKYAVRCSNMDRGPAVKKACSAGCLGCMLCVKQCENGAITVKNNIASIDYAKCTGCGKCAEKCPAKVIYKVQ